MCSINHCALCSFGPVTVHLHHKLLFMPGVCILHVRELNSPYKLSAVTYNRSCGVARKIKKNKKDGVHMSIVFVLLVYCRCCLCSDLLFPWEKKLWLVIVII